MQYITEAEIDGITSATGKALGSEPKVTIVIRPENGEAFWEGGVNGHFFRIRTNESVAVPKSLARLIAQTLEAWRDKLTRYLNDAIIDLTSELQPRRTDELTLTDGTLDLSGLPRAVVKVLALNRESVRLPFYYGLSSEKLRVPAVDDGAIQVTYRYMPESLKVDTDVPDLPEWCHGALIGYAVGRERAAGDAASVNAARACFELYNAAKRCMRAHRGELDAFTLQNCI